MRRALSITVLTLSIAAGSACVASAQTPPPEEPRIRAGVTVAGVDVGALTVAEAEATHAQALGPALAADVTVTARGRAFALKMADIGFRFRADMTALRALYAGQDAPPAADGTLPPAAATPSVSFRRKPVWRFVRDVAARVNVPARDARLKITLTRLIKRPG